MYATMILPYILIMCKLDFIHILLIRNMGRSNNSHKIFPRIFLRIELLAISKGVCSPTWDSYYKGGGYSPWWCQVCHMFLVYLCIWLMAIMLVNLLSAYVADMPHKHSFISIIIYKWMWVRILIIIKSSEIPVSMGIPGDFQNVH